MNKPTFLHESELNECLQFLDEWREHPDYDPHETVTNLRGALIYDFTPEQAMQIVMYWHGLRFEKLGRDLQRATAEAEKATHAYIKALLEAV